MPDGAAIGRRWVGRPVLVIIDKIDDVGNVRIRELRQMVIALDLAKYLTNSQKLRRRKVLALECQNRILAMQLSNTFSQFRSRCLGKIDTRNGSGKVLFQLS